MQFNERSDMVIYINLNKPHDPFNGYKLDYNETCTEFVSLERNIDIFSI